MIAFHPCPGFAIRATKRGKEITRMPKPGHGCRKVNLRLINRSGPTFSNFHRRQRMPAEPQREHQWLHKLVGTWSMETECSMGPDQPPAKTKGTEARFDHSRGGFWQTVG